MKYLVTGSDYLKRREGFRLVGMDEKLERLSSILMRSKANSVMLVGPGGAGATALCLGLQASKGDEHAAFDIVSKRFFWLEADELFSSGDPRSIDSCWQKIVGLLKRTPDSVLMIEDTRDFIEGARNSGCPHFINSLVSMVKQGDTQAVIEVRDEDVAFVKKAHSDFTECFTMMQLNEPTGDILKEISHANASNLEVHHGIRISPDAIDTAIALTTKYRSSDSSLSRAQPERTANLIDRALSTFRLEVHKKTPDDVQAKIKAVFRELRDGEVAIDRLEEELDAQLEAEKQPRNQDGTEAFSSELSSAGFDSESVRKIKEKIARYQAVVTEGRGEFKSLTSDLNKDLILTADMVLEEFSRITGIPASKLSENEIEKLNNLEADLKKTIFGQDDVIEKVCDAIKVDRVGVKRTQEPVAFMFAGPSGVGKTELTKQLASILGMQLLKIDMSEFMEKHAVAKLIGAPPGYDGFEEGGMLTNSVRDNPHQVILFDEIEKAHTSVFNILLQVLSDGTLRDSAGLSVDFSNTIVVLTTNIGSSYFLDKTLTMDQAVGMMLADLQAPVDNGGAGLRPELLNRFNGRENIYGFKALPLEIIEKIAMREFERINDSYTEMGISTTIPEKALESFCKDNYSPVTGARGIPGIIKARIKPKIVNTILKNPSFKGTLEVGYDSGNFVTNLRQAA